MNCSLKHVIQIKISSALSFVKISLSSNTFFEVYAGGVHRKDLKFYPIDFNSGMRAFLELQIYFSSGDRYLCRPHARSITEVLNINVPQSTNAHQQRRARLAEYVAQ